VHYLFVGAQRLPVIGLLLLACRALYQVFGARLRRVGARLVHWIDLGGFTAVTVGALGSTGILASAPHAIETAPFNPMWVLGWLIGAVQILWRDRREAVMRQLGMLGLAAPFLYSLAFTTCSLTFFTYTTMAQHLTFDRAGDAYELRAGRVAAFYIWHFLALLPGVEVPQTLKWEEPLQYSSHILGAHVLAFQLTVALTVISLVKSFLQSRRTNAPADEVTGSLPAEVISHEGPHDAAPVTTRSRSGGDRPSQHRRAVPARAGGRFTGRRNALSAAGPHRTGRLRIAGHPGRG
jgi:hypothetical protein